MARILIYAERYWRTGPDGEILVRADGGPEVRVAPSDVPLPVRRVLRLATAA